MEKTFNVSCLTDAVDLLKMFKFFRFPHFMRYSRNFFKRMGWRHFHYKIWKLIITTMIVFHATNCVRFLVLLILEGKDATVGWGKLHGLELYFHAMYETFSILCRFGFHYRPTGAYTRTNDWTSLLCTSLLVVFGFILRAFLIAYVYMFTLVGASSGFKASIVWQFSFDLRGLIKCG